MKKKRMYESPHTQVNTVVTESGFCAASVIENDKNSKIKTTGQEIGLDVDAGQWEDEWK